MTALLLSACSGSSDTAVPSSSGLDANWIARVARSPADFSALLDGDGRDAWTAFHRNDWLSAATRGGVAGARACDELATFHEVLAGVAETTWLRLGDTWEARGTLPAQSAFPRLVVIAAQEAGNSQVEAHWAALAAPPLATDRAELHDAVRAGTGDLEALRSLARTPLVTESSAPSPGGLGSTTRIFYDPRVHRSLAMAYRKRAALGSSAGSAPSGAAASAAKPDDLARTVFSAHLGPAGTDDATFLTSIGVKFPTDADDAEACREAVRSLDSALDPWRLKVAGSATGDGRALLDDLRLVEGARARLLVQQGVAALGADHANCALAYAEMAMDHESARAVNPINSPTLFAVVAAADLRTGHTREALDALEVLTGPFPEAVALDETVGDLAVLEGIDRAGDSREN